MEVEGLGSRVRMLDDVGGGDQERDGLFGQLQGGGGCGGGWDGVVEAACNSWVRVVAT